ncbi:eukaryotic translation initiation factor 3 subunit E [Coniosporium apollinis CBS 100218]|uniref:Eukaryotic translation initiation factor 3 subunit E n=1 Tax=Coniosporium apollinis (strain CBS 100218) TaxID=1168221 RepID=R7YZ11_CONA1|nr:eukaryotic translation initiation factor 3 subunit E [Coniosporium apollinis CBS 100218]EON67029.1 eukaryotic translation initiation factor 3 subunit E [Coniosporium apollinis CBS 100218]
MADTQTNGATASADSLAQYDLFPKLVQNLDRHLVFPIINAMGDEDDAEIARLRFELLKPTNMADFLENLDLQLHGKPTLDYQRMREEVGGRMQQLREETALISEILENQDVINQLRSDKEQNLKFLTENYGVTADMVNKLYELGQLEYSCGMYEQASNTLFKYRLLAIDNPKVDEAAWGRVACQILAEEYESVLDELNKIAETIESRFFGAPLPQLQQRVWLIHWSLFPFFNYEPARDILTERFFQPQYINTIQTACPWILRYLTAAVITNRQRSRQSNQYQKQLKDLVRIVRQELYEYRDPVTDFIKALYVDFDFEEAQKKLGEAALILQKDFFLSDSADAFVEAARHLISESYCKIHQRIDIKDLSTRLGLSQSEGELWIVNLIRDTRVDAKIDYKAGTVIMNHPPQSVYQQIIERTKGGFFRTQVLSAAVGK